ncbi:MAG: hypothetical protein NC246_16610 [Muribaculaceae bacterium]|nr:hypothetical protein [Muribaculaceae bacterium]
MDSYIDIHSHILPGIDDGAPNFDASMKMLRTAWADGIKKIIATPHYKPGHHNADPEKIHSLMDQLRREAEKEGIEAELYSGNEFYYHDGMFRKLEEGRAETLAESSYVLIEFGPMEGFGYIRGGLYEALAHGWRPVLAHVERYSAILGEPEKVEELIRLGSCIQVNAGSILGRTGMGAKQFVRRLLKEGLVHFVATDAHDTERRKPELSGCAKYISRKYGEACARRLFHENPMRILRNEYI